MWTEVVIDGADVTLKDKRPSSSSMVDMPHSFDWIAMAWYLRPFSLVCFGIAAIFEEWAVTFGFLGLLQVLYVFYRSQSVEGKGRGVLITGCDSGFGHQLAKSLQALNFTVFATCLDRNSPGGEALQRLGVHVLTVDITCPQQVAGALKTVEEHLPPLGLWALVNNAGISIHGFAEWIPIECYEKLISVNLVGHIRMTQTFLPLMRRTSKDGGRIVNMTSTLARIFVPKSSAYCLSKSAMNAFSSSLRRELTRFNIDVCTVEPGNFRTATAIAIPSGLVSTAMSWQHLSDDVRNDYGDGALRQLEQSVEVYNRVSGSDIGVVCDAMAEAVIRRHPKSRYVAASFFEWQMVCWHQLLPDFLMDVLIVIGEFVRTHLLLNDWI